jgi:circadian clock protein KaiB
VRRTSDEGGESRPPRPVHSFRLFVAGTTPRNEQVIRNLEQVCRDALGDQFRLLVIDVREQPEAAEAARILATPTLIREAPAPVQRIIGNLADRGQLLEQLGLDEDRDSLFRTDWERSHELQ